ncbi:MAG: hypothetical protein ACOC5K_01655, partial [Chloroflexota bacterium]
AFTSNRDGNREVYVMEADGSAQTRLSNTEPPERAKSQVTDNPHADTAAEGSCRGECPPGAHYSDE